MAQADSESTWRIFDGLDGSQVAAVLMAIDDGAIRLAELAEGRAMTPSVAHLALDLVAFHRQMRDDVASFVARRHIEPSPGLVSDAFDDATSLDLTTFDHDGTRSFDRRYVAEQIHQEAEALRLVDRIVPHVEDPELVTLLTDTRRKLEAHIHMAEALSGQL
jgi:predicted outer membrane protein